MRKPSREERFILTRGGRGLIRPRRMSGSTSRGGDPGAGADNLLVEIGSNLLSTETPQSVILISN